MTPHPKDEMPPPASTEALPDCNCAQCKPRETGPTCGHCGEVLPKGWHCSWHDHGCHHTPPKYVGAEFMQVDPSTREDYYGGSAEDRKKVPLATGCLDYFPNALAAVAHCSWVGNKQHHPGEPLHWDKAKSNDHADCAMRHFAQRRERDSDGTLHLAKACWRMLAELETELEKGGAE